MPPRIVKLSCGTIPKTEKKSARTHVGHRLVSRLHAGGDDGGSKALANSATTTSEIKFGKHLASSDKRVRDRTVAALREWLRQRSRGGSLTDLDLLKVGHLSPPRLHPITDRSCRDPAYAIVSVMALKL